MEEWIYIVFSRFLVLVSYLFSSANMMQCVKQRKISFERTVNNRAVCILLECNLVFQIHLVVEGGLNPRGHLYWSGNRNVHIEQRQSSKKKYSLWLNVNEI